MTGAGGAQRHGFSADHAAAIARNVAAGERDGCASHGLWRLLALSIPCVKARYRLMPSRRSTTRRRRLCGRMQGAPFRCWPTSALPLLLEKARHSGIAALAINRCVHFSALFADIEPLTEAGLVGLACTPSHAWSPRRAAPVRCSAPTLSPLAGRGGTSRRLLLIWRPAPARGEIQLHQRAGKALPKGGESTVRGSRPTDAAEVLNGAMLTFGGHGARRWRQWLSCWPGRLSAI